MDGVKPAQIHYVNKHFNGKYTNIESIFHYLRYLSYNYELALVVKRKEIKNIK